MSAQATLNTGGNIHWPLQTKMIILERILPVRCGGFQCCSDDQILRRLLRVPDLSSPSVLEWSGVTPAPGGQEPGLCTPLIDLYPACTSTVGGFELRHWFVDFNLARVQRLQILLCTYRSGNIYEPGTWFGSILSIQSQRLNCSIGKILTVDYLHVSLWFLRFKFMAVSVSRYQ